MTTRRAIDHPAAPRAPAGRGAAIAAIAAIAAAIGAIGAIGCAPTPPREAGASPQALEASAERLGELLVRGQTLHYVRDGGTQPAWTVDSVREEVGGDGRSECVRAWIRRGAAASPAVFTCRVGDTLVVLGQASGRWTAARPLGPGMRLEVAGPQATRGIFTSEALERAILGGRALTVVPTTVLTLDAAGKPVRRLRERYAPALLTALDGVFERPDSTTPSGWRPESRFHLERIVP